MYSFLIQNRNLVRDLLLFLAIALVIFGVAGKMQNFFLGFASTLTLLRIADNLAARQRKKKASPMIKAD